MPIKGLSDERRLPRAGKIHLGVKKKSASGNLYPSATDHFVVQTDKSTTADAAAAFHAAYGLTPRVLDIFIPPIGNTLDAIKEVIFPQYYKQYGLGTGLKCKGTGETAERLDVDRATGVVLRKPIQCAGPDACAFVKRIPDGHGGSKGDCGPVAHFQFLLPKVEYLGVWQIDTGSEISIRQLNSDMELIWMAAGRLSHIPLRLELVPREVSPGGRKKTVFTLTLTYPGSLKQLSLLRPQAGSFLIDMVDDEDAPEDLRPETAAHPLSGRLPAPAPEQEPPPEPPADAATVLEDPEDALPAQPMPEFTYKLDGPAPEPTEDPVYNGIVFHAWRCGVEPATLAVTSRLHKTPETLLTALQKTPTPPARALELAKMGYRIDGLQDLPPQRKKS